MKQEIPTPILVATLAAVVLVAGLLMWRHYSAPPTMPAGMAAPSYHGTVDQKIDMLRRVREFETRQGAAAGARTAR